MDQLNTQTYKRNIAYKLRIGSLVSGSPILENEKLKFVEIQGKQIIRVNVIANIIDKFIQEGEKKFGSITLDDATGQIKVKVFGDDLERFQNLNQCVKELSKISWILIHNKPNYTGISLNPKFKKEIVEFIEKQMPDARGWIN